MSRAQLSVPSKVNSLTPLRFVPKSASVKAHWICLCDCGRECIKHTTELRKGDAKSCGCRKYEAVAAGLSKALKKHGQSGYNLTAEYRAWKAIHNRCSNPNFKNYANYSGRGIRVCERWSSFENFFADMGPRPADMTSIDRKDVNGNYEPGNCEWSNSYKQARHRTDNVLIEFKGRTLCLNDWATETDIKRETISRRLSAGWTVERAFTEKPDQRSWTTRRGKL